MSRQFVVFKLVLVFHPSVGEFTCRRELCGRDNRLCFTCRMLGGLCLRRAGLSVSGKRRKKHEDTYQANLVHIKLGFGYILYSVYQLSLIQASDSRSQSMQRRFLFNCSTELAPSSTLVTPRCCNIQRRECSARV